jgi:spermidine/putrescine transport system ATP-binding protein
MSDTILELKHITKNFGTTEVLRDVDIQIGKGEFITLLGPSGCGKTTILRIIAGLEEPDSGSVYLNGEDVTDTEPNKRDVNTVFQNYALFPHMTVEENISYGMKLRKIEKKKMAAKVAEALELVQLSGYNKRMPSELSGGQKQRVAVARAIVNNPKVLLLDEPLGALDLQLRRQMQTELKRLQKKLGITFIYITHDQEEAMNMSDRIAVMRDGLFEQIGSPAEIYDQPRTSYVAEFVGNANLIHGKVIRIQDNIADVETAGGNVQVRVRKQQPDIGMAVTLAVRSENVRLYTDRIESGIKCVLKDMSFSGGVQKIILQLEDGTEIVSSSLGMNFSYEINSELYIGFDANHGVLVDL